MASGFHLAFFLCLTGGLLMSATVSACRPCPRRWRYDSRCFIVVTRKKTMADAEKICGRIGGNLASIHNLWEHNFIRRLIYKRCRSYAPAWIGLSDAIQERTWLWSDGSTARFTRWAREEPNNKRKREHCTEINFKRGRFWGDVRCSLKLPFVCARKL